MRDISYNMQESWTKTGVLAKLHHEQFVMKKKIVTIILTMSHYYHEGVLRDEAWVGLMSMRDNEATNSLLFCLQ